MNMPTYNPVYKSMNKPLTVWGVERRLFLVAMVVGAATFSCFNSFRLLNRVSTQPDVPLVRQRTLYQRSPTGDRAADSMSWRVRD